MPVGTCATLEMETVAEKTWRLQDSDYPGSSRALGEPSQRDRILRWARKLDLSRERALPCGPSNCTGADQVVGVAHLRVAAHPIEGPGATQRYGLEVSLGWPGKRLADWLNEAYIRLII